MSYFTNHYPESTWPDLEFPDYVPTAEDWEDYRRHREEQDRLADESAIHDGERFGTPNTETTP